jgi:SpoVK/Ycf46/Vps4 family AAA+-type ATPase
MNVISRKSRQASAFAEWAEEVNANLDLGLQEGDASDWIDALRPQNPNPQIWEMLKQVVAVAFDKLGTSASVTPFVENVGIEMGLDRIETEILQFLIDYCTVMATERLWDKLSDAEGESHAIRLDSRFLAMMLGREEAEIDARLTATAPLRDSGLIRADHKSGVSVLPRLLFLATQPMDSILDVRGALLGEAQAASLTLHDFAHIGRDVEQVLGILRSALKTRAKGVVAVLYGPPGTGKTCLAKALAAALAVPIYSIGETDQDGQEPSRADRLSELQASLRLLSSAEPAILLLDEGEDLFGDANDFFAMIGARRNVGSKAYIHRLIENASVPLIITANSLNAFGAAVLRRMTCCIEIRVPPVAVRAKIWQHAAAAEGIEVDRQEVYRLARHIPAAPAVASSAMRAAALGGGSKETISWALEGVVKAMTGKPIVMASTPTEFDLDLVDADQDLSAIADRLSQPDAPKNVSLLLSGPSGSGKSLFARHLAERMGLEVVQKRASDLLGKYVGETEKRIAASFQQAIDESAFLIFDEADSLLGDRRQADRGWMVSQVNEMLTWMEVHPLPFCCTTNFMDRLDKAAMRRFLVKVQFGPLRRDQAALAFERFFGVEPPCTIADLDGLTPSDFALVHRQAQLHGTLDDPDFLLASLVREQSAKGSRSRPMGFLH